MVDFYGFHVGKYTVRPMDRMGYAALTLSPYKGGGLFNVTMCNPLKVKPLTGNFGKWCLVLGCGSFPGVSQEAFDPKIQALQSLRDMYPFSAFNKKIIL